MPARPKLAERYGIAIATVLPIRGIVTANAPAIERWNWHRAANRAAGTRGDAAIGPRVRAIEVAKGEDQVEDQRSSPRGRRSSGGRADPARVARRVRRSSRRGG